MSDAVRSQSAAQIYAEFPERQQVNAVFSCCAEKVNMFYESDRSMCLDSPDKLCGWSQFHYVVAEEVYF